MNSQVSKTEKMTRQRKKPTAKTLYLEPLKKNTINGATLEEGFPGELRKLGDWDCTNFCFIAGPSKAKAE